MSNQVVEVNDEVEYNIWQSCYIHSDQDAIVYFSQFTIALIVMTFFLI